MRRCRAITLLVLAAACGREKPAPSTDAASLPPDTTASPPAGPQVAAYTATDFAFEGPSETPAGPTRFTLTNQGKEVHHLVVVRIEQGRSFDSLLAALKKSELPPKWAHAIGGPNAVSPTISSDAVLGLTPGKYAVVCLIPSPDHVPHLAKGMIRPLSVTPSDRQVSESPADLTMNLTNYDFKLSGPVTAGTRVIRVANTADQLHEVVVVRLEPGKTMKDMFGWEMSGRKGPAPGQYVGGMAPLAPGDTGDFSLAFEPGSYALICFVPDAKDGKLHAMHGMLKTLTVS
jgi:uncharacterized cupredoxin-like copper-binding protein